MKNQKQLDLTDAAIGILSNIDDNMPVNINRLTDALHKAQSNYTYTDNHQLFDWLYQFATDETALEAIDHYIDEYKHDLKIPNRYQRIERLAKLGAQIELTKLANESILRPGQNLMYPAPIKVIIGLPSTKQIYPITQGDLIDRIKELQAK